jgi:lactate permease
MPWVQVYDPLGHAWLSTLAAALPTGLLLLTLGLLRWPAHRAAFLGLLAAIAVSVGVFGMPISAAVATTVYGAAYGLFPIGWIVLAAIFLYNLSVRSGTFEVVKHSVARLSGDRRVQALLIAFSFGAFIEGASGFGTPVAISAALLVGLGFAPRYAATLSLIANTAPVAFGAIGTPILTLAAVTGLPAFTLGAMAGRQLPFVSVLVPAWLIVTMSGWRGLRGVWPAVLVCGGSFAIVQFAWSNLVGPELVDIVGGLVSLGALGLLCLWWKPSDGDDASPSFRSSPGPSDPGFTSQQPATFDVAGEGGSPKAKMAFGHPEDMACGHPAAEAAGLRASGLRAAGLRASGLRASVAESDHAGASQVVRAWLPWILLSVFVTLWGLPSVKALLNRGPVALGWRGSAWTWLAPQFEVPALHRRVFREYPVVATPVDRARIGDGGYRRAGAESALFSVNWLSATGTSVLCAALVTALALRMRRRAVVDVARDTWRQMKRPLITIAMMMALGFVTRYGGTDATLGLAFTHTGWLYPFFAAMLGWLGVALTGSDTSANVLFGGLQKITAQQLGLDPILITAANSTGGVMGKMIAAQTIVVATAATHQQGEEGALLRSVFWHSLALAAIMGLIVLAQAYLVPWMVPSP